MGYKTERIYLGDGVSQLKDTTVLHVAGRELGFCHEKGRGKSNNRGVTLTPPYFTVGVTITYTVAI